MNRILCLFTTVKALYVVDVELCGYRVPSVVLVSYRHLLEKKKTSHEEFLQLHINVGHETTFSDGLKVRKQAVTLALPP